MIDAGFSGKEVEKRLLSIGRSLDNIQAICLTHEHNDHISGAGVLSRRCKIPLYANAGTHKAGEKRMGKAFKQVEFETGSSFEVGQLSLRSFQVSHDTVDPVGFVVSDGVSRLGYCTDTGKVSHLMGRRLQNCNGLVLEFNHNLELLKNGPYPLPLQQRVRSSRGHLCNEDAAEFLASLLNQELRCVVLAHLSEQNNTPELAKVAAMKAVPADWGEIELHMARQHQALELIEI